MKDDMRQSDVRPSMDDLTATRLCAEAMGLKVNDVDIDTAYDGEFGPWPLLDDSHALYDPLHDDAQAMAVVKRFKMEVGYKDGWSAIVRDPYCQSFHYETLNGAIVECIAQRQKAKVPA